MAQIQTRIRFSYQDYKNLPECEGKHYELLDGDLIMTPSPSWKHQQVAGKLEMRLRLFVEQHRLGRVADAPLDVVMGEDVVQPDILFISRRRSEVIREQEVRGAPDLVVEVLSPSTGKRDRTYKKTLYARLGVREYWLVDPAGEAVEVLVAEGEGFRQFGLYGKGETLRSSILEGLEIRLEEVFADEV